MRALGKALQALQAKESVMDACIEVNRIEEEADAVERTMWRPSSVPIRTR